MTGEYWKMQNIAKAERGKDEVSERLGIHSEEYKAKNCEIKELTSEWKNKIGKRNGTTAKTMKEMWSILRSLTTNQSDPTAEIITDNGRTLSVRSKKLTAL